MVSRGKDGTPRFNAETRNAIMVEEMLAHIAERGSENMDIPAQDGVQFMVEEVMHSFDHVGGNRTLSASSPLFNMNDGVIVVEAKAAYQSGGRLFEMLPYPLRNDFAFMSDGQKQAELFARLAMAYLGDPQMMKEVMPNAYKVYEQLIAISFDPVSEEANISPFFWGNSNPDGSGKIRG